MTTFRPFRNSDPPALVDLWNRALPDRGVVRPLTAHEFDTLVMGKLGFDRLGLTVADREGRIIGFAHAGFGPQQPLGPSHQLDTSMGTLAMLATEPGMDDPEVEMGLILASERYLRARGAQVFYAGGQNPVDPFYAGIYGGSEFAGVLDSHPDFRRAVMRAGYEPVATTVILEADLSRPEIRDPKALLLRRQLRLDIVDDARTPGWWEALAIGLFRPSRYTLIDKNLGLPVAQAWNWEIAGGFGVGDGRCRSGLIDVEVHPDHRRKGYGRHLVGEVLKRVREQSTDVLSTQTSSENLPALALYQSLGFDPIDAATLYRLPAEVAKRSLPAPA